MLQSQIEGIEASITVAETTMKLAGGVSSKVARRRTQGLRETHTRLTQQVEDLYCELDVGEAFPDIRDFGFEFARALVMAYDAKCIARQKITGRFFEWDMLDRAVGGKGHALGKSRSTRWGLPSPTALSGPIRLTTPTGTDQHQRTVSKMKNRTPALVRAVTRYNTLCDRLKELLPADKNFPIPEKLPEDLAKLKNEPSLLEDVWISADTPAGLWLTDKAVRRGIRAQHILDRCSEECIRLKQEERSLYAWVFDEVLALEHAMHESSSELDYNVVGG